MCVLLYSHVQTRISTSNLFPSSKFNCIVLLTSKITFVNGKCIFLDCTQQLALLDNLKGGRAGKAEVRIVKELFWLTH